ncbi:uncharacterized protein LOC122058740 [Macadamia integrifolia]|uniref:uncharacterized protein LOC122058740 n=1 Tax=Macadamia integrifolia TaxID=60698 RepID=UPI001C4FB2D6|nr:uncharacterized protein LOC122058740 [Macadamia integrifolia]
MRLPQGLATSIRLWNRGVFQRSVNQSCLPRSGGLPPPGSLPEAKALSTLPIAFPADIFLSPSSDPEGVRISLLLLLLLLQVLSAVGGIPVSVPTLCQGTHLAYNCYKYSDLDPSPI